jgi:hypothetical protein
MAHALLREYTVPCEMIHVARSRCDLLFKNVCAVADSTGLDARYFGSHRCVSRASVTCDAPDDVASITPRERDRSGAERSRRAGPERSRSAGFVGGHSNNVIASRLHVAELTVKHHPTSILRKSGLLNGLELALFAMHQRLDVSSSAEFPSHATGKRLTGQ